MRKTVISLVAALICMLTVACRFEDTSEAMLVVDSGEIVATESVVKIVTSSYPLEYFARRIGGDAVKVINVVPPGTEVHNFEPAPASIRVINSADLVLYNGPEFEPWLGPALESMDDAGIVVEVGVGLVGVQHSKDNFYGGDPHVWLDPLLAVKQAEAIRDVLIQMIPKSGAQFRTATKVLVAELESLHRDFVDGLSSCDLNVFVPTHAAYGHLASRYELEQKAMFGLSPEAEISPSELAQLVDYLTAIGVRYVLTEPNMSLRYAEVLSREINATLLELHPLESLTPNEAERDEDYFSIMDSNLQTLQSALECV